MLHLGGAERSQRCEGEVLTGGVNCRANEEGYRPLKSLFWQEFGHREVPLAGVVIESENARIST